MKNFHTLADLSKWRERGEAPLRLAVLGDPVSHSRSPEMQNAALLEEGLAARYGRLEIAPNELAEAVRLCAALNFIGLNLTVPHKIAAAALIEKKDAFARAVGAINTIRFEQASAVGANTDGPGFARAIGESFGFELSRLRVLVLGAGGAGRGVAAQCALAKVPALKVVNRDFAKAQALAQRWPEIEAFPWEKDSLGKAISASDLIVQATPLGSQSTDQSPLPMEFLSPRHLVYDLNYQPTALLAAARTAGARVASGLTMLLHQGALAFEFWFDRPAPLAVMRRALDL